MYLTMQMGQHLSYHEKNKERKGEKEERENRQRKGDPTESCRHPIRRRESRTVELEKEREESTVARDKKRKRGRRERGKKNEEPKTRESRYTDLYG